MKERLTLQLREFCNLKHYAQSNVTGTEETLQMARTKSSTLGD